MSSDYAFSIGPVQVRRPVVLAALAGYSDLAYRQVCRARGDLEYCHTEMMLDRMMALKPNRRDKLPIIARGDRPLAAQIIGNEPAEMATAAGILSELEFDVIDLNFACPVNKALRRRRGGWLMREPQQAVEIVRAVLAATHLPVTLKLRQKFAADDDHENFWRIAGESFEAGVSAVCVHGRSVEVKYRGHADWQFIAEVKRRFADRVIIGSGDVLSPQRGIDMLRETGVDAVAAARGALGNPWFFRQMAELLDGRQMHQPSLAEQREVLLEHMDRATELYGPVKAPRIMRGFGIRYARLHPSPKDLRMAFVAVRRPQEWYDVVDRYYQPMEQAGAR
jgi:nifR3 family TIM-barrel protein